MNHRGTLIGEISRWSMIVRVSVALSFVSEDNYRTGCWNVSHRQQLSSPIIIIIVIVVVILLLLLLLLLIIEYYPIAYSIDCGCGPAYKFVTLDADPHHKSQRPETCIVRYHGNFCTHHAFEIELHWIAATGSIVNNMVGWKTSKFYSNRSNKRPPGLIFPAFFMRGVNWSRKIIRESGRGAHIKAKRQPMVVQFIS